jgi:hypothetical protein
MKPEHLKFAGVVTVVCGSMFSFEAGAALGDAPTVATGTVSTMPGAPLDAAAAAAAVGVAPATGVAPAANVASGPDRASDAPSTAAPGFDHSLSSAIDKTLSIDAARPDDDGSRLAAVSERSGGTAPSDADPAWASADLVAVPERRLDNMRGGFDLPSGLMVSFGISRAAYVNGNLVAQTSFNIPDIATMTTQQAQMLANANTGALVQVGPGNSVQPSALPGLTGALIQNTLSGQKIQGLTTINTSVNSLGAFTAMNFLSTLNNALNSAVRPR